MRYLALILLTLSIGCAPRLRLMPAGLVQAETETDKTVVRAAPPMEEIDHLRIAVNLVDKGEHRSAIVHLDAHLQEHPDATMIRSYVAELYWKEGMNREARLAFERFHREAGDTGPSARHLLHVHTRLTEIAMADNDEFREHLHRGIALYLMVKQWDETPIDGSEALTESTLLSAVGELKQSRELQSDDPRSDLYLHFVYVRLGQPSAARQAHVAVMPHLHDPSICHREREALRCGE